jgi:hypothetical protein
VVAGEAVVQPLQIRVPELHDVVYEHTQRTLGSGQRAAQRGHGLRHGQSLHACMCFCIACDDEAKE